MSSLAAAAVKSRCSSASTTNGWPSRRSKSNTPWCPMAVTPLSVIRSMGGRSAVAGRGGDRRRAGRRGEAGGDLDGVETGADVVHADGPGAAEGADGGHGGGGRVPL